MEIPRFSLVVATMGRTHELERLLRSIHGQSLADYEIVVVDQNPDDRLERIMASFPGAARLRHERCAPGLSRARNLGLSHCTGEIVGFPDDDCIYPTDLLERVARLLDENLHLDGVCGKVVDPEGADCARFEPNERLVTPRRAWQQSASVSMFLRRRVFDTVGGFDEALGVGSGTPWAGGEDIDFVIRVVQSGFRVLYTPSLQVVHPNPLRKGYAQAAARAFRYGAGIGRVWRKHRFPWWVVAYHLARPLGGAAIGLMTGRGDKARYHWWAFAGRLKGWMAPLDR